jgi:hypothetical protein
METVVMLAPPEEAANLAPDDVDVRLTVSAAVVALPKESCSCTVIGPSAALAAAVPETALELKASWLTLPAVIASGLEVVGENPTLEAVRV